MSKFSGFLVASGVALVGFSGFAMKAEAANVDVSAAVVAQCTLVANALAFGNYVNGQASAKNGQADVSYDCASGLDITLNLSSGANPGGGNVRNMESPTTFELLSYELFQDAARSVDWGSGAAGINVNPTPGRGAQTHTIFGEIPPNLAVTPATNYADVVVFDLTVN
ncbi:MAG: Csu type fimbrial protein [Geminicoccaceae bacterium]